MMAQRLARLGRIEIVSSVAAEPATMEAWVSDGAGFDTHGHTDERGRTGSPVAGRASRR